MTTLATRIPDTVRQRSLTTLAENRGADSRPDHQQAVRQRSLTTLAANVAAVDYETRLDARVRLRIARSRICDPTRWTQNAAARMADGANTTIHFPGAARWCASGSLALIDIPPGGVLAATLAKDALNCAAVQRGYAGIVCLNDASETTHTDVIATFDEAIKLLE